MAPSDDPDWYLHEWAALRGKKQADLARDLNWHKNTGHLVWHGRQPYRRDIVNAVAAWLEIEPFELLLPPERALALRRLTETAQLIAAEAAARYEGPPPAGAKARRSAG